MQFLEDDSQEWMRKAAEEFPVKPFGMNWETVAMKLHEEAPRKGVIGFMFFRYVAMVAFFMLLSLVCNKYLRLDFENRYNSQVTLERTPTNKDLLKQNLQGKQTVWEQIDVSKNRRSNGSNSLDESVLLNQHEELITGISKKQINQLSKQSASLINSIPEFEHKKILTNNIIKSLPESSIVEKIKAKESEADLKMRKLKIGVPTNSRLYIGLLFGPDISSIKFQKSSGVGYNLGLLVGYQFSNKWQFESGVLLNRKEYYSSGEYFNAKETYLPAHSYITKVDGYCTMFEIPMQVRYNIQHKEHTNWLATVGISSYLMNKEDYDYTYKRYNQLYSGNKIYRNASKDWLTTINASIGYEKEISKKIQVRLEPYLKLPLKGMGTGKLPISSAGMNVGVNYPIK